MRDVARGQRRIVGPLAVARADPVAPPAASGLINDRLHLGPDGAEPALAEAADRLAAQPQGLVRILSAILRYATAVAVDWRSLRVPPTESAPRLARDS